MPTDLVAPIQRETLQYDPDRIHDLPLSEVFADEDWNCRGIIDPMTVIDLANDIKDREKRQGPGRGLIQPITVQPWNGKPGKKWRIIAGYRRYKAHQINKSPTIRATILEGLSEIDARVENLKENLHRENLTMKQEAHAIEVLKRAGWTEGQVADKLKQSRGWVQVRFMFIDLPDDIQDEAVAFKFTQQQIRDLHSLHTREDQYALVRKLKDAKIKGNKREVNPESVKTKNERRPRSREEIFAMQALLHDLQGKNSILTRILGWAAGEVSDLDVHRSIQQWVREEFGGKFYAIPSGLEGSRAEQMHREVSEIKEAGHGSTQHESR